MKALTRLGQRRYPVQGGYTTEQARELALLSRALGRQVGLVIDRQGKVDMVIVGDPASILIPELPRGRGAAGRLRGIRLMHTHLSPDGLSQYEGGFDFYSFSPASSRPASMTWSGSCENIWLIESWR